MNQRERHRGPHQAHSGSAGHPSIPVDPDWPEGRYQAASDLLAHATALPQDVVQLLLMLGHWRGPAAGEILFRANVPSDFWLLVLRGRVTLEMLVPGRGKVPILTLGPGDIVGWSAVLGHEQMTTSAVATDEETEVVAFPAAEVHALCQRDPQVGYLLMRHLALSLADRLVATRLQLLDLYAHPPREAHGQ